MLIQLPSEIIACICDLVLVSSLSRMLGVGGYPMVEASSDSDDSDTDDPRLTSKHRKRKRQKKNRRRKKRRERARLLQPNYPQDPELRPYVHHAILQLALVHRSFYEALHTSSFVRNIWRSVLILESLGTSTIRFRVHLGHVATQKKRRIELHIKENQSYVAGIPPTEPIAEALVQLLFQPKHLAYEHVHVFSDYVSDWLDDFIDHALPQDRLSYVEWIRLMNTDDFWPYHHSFMFHPEDYEDGVWDPMPLHQWRERMRRVSVAKEAFDIVPTCGHCERCEEAQRAQGGTLTAYATPPLSCHRCWHAFTFGACLNLAQDEIGRSCDCPVLKASKLRNFERGAARETSHLCPACASQLSTPCPRCDIWLDPECPRASKHPWNGCGCRG